MKKQIAAILLTGSMVLSMSACGDEKKEEEPAGAATETQSGQEESLQASEDTSLFSEFAQLEFTFSSGAGGWATLMDINADGTFSGEYFDGELGVTGEGYPNGTQYQCDFTGKFTEPVKVNDFTYSMQIQEISYEKEPGTEEIINEMLFCYSDAYGLEGAEDILIYMPGAPLTELPEEYRSWVGYYDLSTTEDTELPFWGLYNVAQECGFASYNIIDSIKETVAYQEEMAAELEASMENEALTQAEYNEKSLQLYKGWDYELNRVWDVLRKMLPETEMESLLAEQREWISQKEQAAAEAGAEVEGGSMQPMVVNLKAAELTKERVYELLKLLE